MLDNGMRLVVARRGTIPLVDVSIQIKTGNMANPAGAPGTASAGFGLLTEGTKRYDANELAAELDRIAMAPSIGAGLERSSFGFRILRTNLVALREQPVQPGRLRRAEPARHGLDAGARARLLGRHDPRVSCAGSCTRQHHHIHDRRYLARGGPGVRGERVRRLEEHRGLGAIAGR